MGFLNFRIWRVVSFNWNSDALYLLSSKSDALFSFKSNCDALFPFQFKIWRVARFFFKINILRKARKSQIISFSRIEKKEAWSLCAIFSGIRDAETSQIQNLVRFFTTMYNICLVKKFFQSLLRCIFPIRHLNSSKILFQTLTLCVFFLNFKIWRVVSFNSKSDALCFSSVQNLTLCKIFNSKSDKL